MKCVMFRQPDHSASVSVGSS